MKKIPSLFERDYKRSGKMALPKVTAGCEWVIAGEGEATEKVDGSACAIIGGALWRRYDANVKKGRKPPIGGIPCQPEPDPVTGHWPHWVPCIRGIPSDQYFFAAYDNTPWNRDDGTYEAVGPHFQGNPYGLDEDVLERHGRIKLHNIPRTYDGVCEWLRTHDVEGIVFWKDGEPRCKIKRSDFGFEWPAKGRE